MPERNRVPGPRCNGAIFEERDKEFEKLPDITGSFDITREFIEALRVAPRDERGNVKIRVAGWKKKGPRRDYISCELEIPKPRKSQGGYDRRDDGHDNRRDDRRDDKSDDRGVYRLDDRRGDRDRDNRRDSRARRDDDGGEDIPF